MTTYTLAEFAKLAGVSTRTLQRWDREGSLIANRTPTNRRQYTERHVAQLRGMAIPGEQKRTVVYCRVSSAAQKGDLVHQRRMLEEFCAARGVAVDEWVEEIGGGMNMKRKKFLSVVDEIVSNRIGRLIIAHEDRFMRFGFPLLEHLCEVADCELIVMNTEALSPKREMVEDLMTIVDCFSSRLNGLGNYRKALQQALSDDQGA